MVSHCKKNDIKRRVARNKTPAINTIRTFELAPPESRATRLNQQLQIDSESAKEILKFYNRECLILVSITRLTSHSQFRTPACLKNNSIEVRVNATKVILLLNKK
jgi:hypothetical protein